MKNFRTLDLNLLRVFDAVMTEGSVTRAAEVLAMTQPAASHALKRLNAWLGEPLFQRSAAGMTPGGRVLVVEGLLIPGGRADGTRLLDLEMLVLTREGRERSKPELRRLFSRAGLKLERVAPLAGFSRLLGVQPWGRGQTGAGTA